MCVFPLTSNIDPSAHAFFKSLSLGRFAECKWNIRAEQECKLLFVQQNNKNTKSSSTQHFIYKNNSFKNGVTPDLFSLIQSYFFGKSTSFWLKQRLISTLL